VLYFPATAAATTTRAIILSRSNIHLFIYDLRKRRFYAGWAAFDCVGRSIQINSKCNWKTIWPAISFYYMYVIHAAYPAAGTFCVFSLSRPQSQLALIFIWGSQRSGHTPNLLCLAVRSLDSKYSRSAPFHTDVLAKEKSVLNGKN
jgi:hypothetical protein